MRKSRKNAPPPIRWALTLQRDHILRTLIEHRRKSGVDTAGAPGSRTNTDGAQLMAHRRAARNPSVRSERSALESSPQVHGGTRGLVVELDGLQMRVSGPGACAWNDAGPGAGGSLRAHPGANRCTRLRASLLLSSSSPPSGRIDAAPAASHTWTWSTCTPRDLHSRPSPCGAHSAKNALHRGESSHSR